MKKIIVFVCTFFLLTGCSAKYNVTIEQNKFTEKTTITIPNNRIEDNDDIKDLLEGKTPAIVADEENEQNYYHKEISKGKKNTTLTLSYQYTAASFHDSGLLNRCFENYQYIDNGNYYYLELSGKFYCLYDNTSIDISVTTDGRAGKTNAKAKGNTYSWNITSKNQDDVNLFLTIMKPIQKAKEKSNVSSIIQLLIGGGITGAIIIFLVRFQKKQEM